MPLLTRVRCGWSHAPVIPATWKSHVRGSLEQRGQHRRCHRKTNQNCDPQPAFQSLCPESLAANPGRLSHKVFCHICFCWKRSGGKESPQTLAHACRGELKLPEWWWLCPPSQRSSKSCVRGRSPANAELGAVWMSHLTPATPRKTPETAAPEDTHDCGLPYPSGSHE